MKKLNFKSIFIPTFSLFIICLIITALLSVTNAATKDKIAENEAQTKSEAMRSICEEAVDFDEIIKDVLYKGKDNSGNTVGYAVSTIANGYGGQIMVMTVIKDDKVIGVEVYYNDDETPGLGKNTSLSFFTDQFKGLPTDENIVVSKDYAGNGQQIDAVTSATISSRAVVAAVNEAVKIYNENTEEGN